MKKLMPPFYFFGFIALEIISHFALPIYSLEYEPYNYLGILIIALGLSLNLVSKRTVVNGKTTIIPFQCSYRLKTGLVTQRV